MLPLTEKDLSPSSHLDEEDSPDLPPELRFAQGAVARQVGPFDGYDRVSDPHHHQANQEAEDVRGAQQEEGCTTDKR